MRFLAALGLLAALPAQNVVVYDNGSFVTNPTGGAGGAPISELQSTAPYNFFILGFNANNGGNVRQTDEFTVNSAMLISEIELFMYNTNATAPSCTGVFLSLFDGDPATGTPNQLIPGAGAAVNLSTTAGFTVTNTMTNIYRVTTTTLGNTARNVQSVRVALPQMLTLTAGTYHLQFSFTGATTPFFPPITTKHVLNTGNGQQYTAGTYGPLQMTSNVAPNPPIPGATQGAPFKFWGPAGPAFPGAITNLGGGCSTMTLDVRGNPAIGGHVRAELANVNPAALGIVVLGVGDPATPLGVCACVSRASLDVLSVATSLELQIPPIPSLVAFPLYFQGLQIDLAGLGGITACNFLGLNLDLTDGYEFRTNFN
jgi:hypothetical protein